MPGKRWTGRADAIQAGGGVCSFCRIKNDPADAAKLQKSAERFSSEVAGRIGEPVGTCTLLSRLKGGGFAIKASGSWPRVRLKLVVAERFALSLAAFSTPCLC